MKRDASTIDLPAVNRIGLEQLNHVYPRFLGDVQQVSGITSSEDFQTLPLRDISRFSDEHRENLVKAVQADLTRWGAPHTAAESAARLRNGRAYAVVTGQQAGLFGGPLYTIYKAQGAIRACAKLRELHPDSDFVPVFWMEADDHDFDEVRQFSLLDRAGDLHNLAYSDNEDRPFSVGDRETNADGIAAVLAEARTILGETDFTSSLFETLEGCYSPGTTLSDGFARLLYTIFGDSELVVVSSRNPELKALAANVFRTDIEQPELVEESVAQRTEQIADDGAPTPISARQGSLFLTTSDGRIRLDPVEGGYHLNGTDTTMWVVDLLALCDEAPERFSPNVALRPLVQDAIFPTALYLGGPSEVAYLRQLTDAYSAMGMEQPAIAPRPFVTLLEPSVIRALAKSHLDVSTMLDASFDVGEYFVDADREEKIQSLLSAGDDAISKAFDLFAETTEEIDPTLEKARDAARHKAAKELENFAGRLRGALKRKNETEIQRVEKAMQLVLPNGGLQERTLSPIYYLNKYGFQAFRRAVDAIELDTGSMQCVEL